MGIDHAADQGFTGDGDEDSNPYPEEAKARDTKGPTSNFAEDNRVGHETEVEDSVHYSDVEIPKDANGCSRGSVKLFGFNIPGILTK